MLLSTSKKEVSICGEMEHFGYGQTHNQESQSTESICPYCFSPNPTESHLKMCPIYPAVSWDMPTEPQLTVPICSYCSSPNPSEAHLKICPIYPIVPLSTSTVSPLETNAIILKQYYKFFGQFFPKHGFEVIEIVLGDENVSIEDVWSFSSTCKRFQKIILRKTFWEKKFYQRCPSVKNKYNTEKRKEICNNTDFKQQIKASLKYVKNLQYYVSIMTEDGLWHHEKKQLEYLLCSIAENLESHIYYFVTDELNRIISTQSSRKPGCRLTSAYKFGIIIRCLKQYRLMYKRNKFINMPKKKQLLERLLTIIVQYFEPHVSTSGMKMCLDIIVAEVLSHLKTEYPAHSIFLISSDQFSDWRNNEIDDNFWDETEARQIIRILKEYFFTQTNNYIVEKLLSKLDLKRSSTYFFSSWLSTQYFDEYLLPFIYHIVARRLGIRCVLTKIGLGHDRIGIAWRPNDNAENLNDAELFVVKTTPRRFINGFNIASGRCSFLYCQNLYSYVEIIKLSLGNYIFNESENYEKCPLELIIIRKIICNNIEEPYITQSIEVRSDTVKAKPKIRNKEIKFAIGMIVKHTRSDFPGQISRGPHFGVIVGWHFEYDDVSLGQENYMNLIYIDEYGDSCINKFFEPNQPHYVILTESNGICYIKQDSISICQPQWIENIEIGRHFSRFEGTHYIPNESLAEKYPNDIAVLKMLFNINKH
ncbi:uncharacterized protein [Anoplolepis gracilipes]|uniref:uncharacterized protein isoform X2 n=1 Tax=Anoplolepis gracilipes TaxID=354296 RepID=UPI003BA06516